MQLRTLTTALVLATLAIAASARADVIEPQGVWRNPRDTVHIELKPCGVQICGYVVWVSDSALAKARKAGHPSLVGQQLMRNFIVDRDGVGRGKVFVPDLNATFSGTAVRLSATTLRARGCVLGNFLCKNQIWTRIDPAAS